MALLSSRAFIATLSAGVVAFTVKTCLYNVNTGHRAVIFNRFLGIQCDIQNEGTHFRLPFIEQPIIFDTRSQVKTVSVITGTKDLQQAQVTLRVLFHPQPEDLPRIFTTWGFDYADRVLPSITNEVLKAVVAQFKAAELITLREIVSHRISDELSERAQYFGLVLDELSVTHLTFGREFIRMVEAKQVAQQDAEKARFAVEKVEQEKKATIIAGEGDAHVAKLIASALDEAGEGLIELRKIEAAEDIALELSSGRKVITYLPSL